MSISKRYEKNPQVLRAKALARAERHAADADIAGRILSNESDIAFIARQLSRCELDRIARFEAYILAHSPDILTPRTVESMDHVDQQMPHNKRL